MSFFPEACQRCRKEGGERGRETVESLRADRDEILQCLIQANLKLQEYDQDRTNFLARAIHDFRAPLTAITGYCGLLIGEDLGKLTNQQREVLERMHRSAKKLSRMAGAMFQLSIAPRLELKLDLRPGEIRNCIEQAVHELLPCAEEKRLSISVDISASPEPLVFEHMQIEQVLVNLLDNACKFSPKGGSIEVRGYPYLWTQTSGNDERLAMADSESRGFNSYRVDVGDSGPGIPPTHMGKIFEEYTSYCGGVDRSGGGLGLAICRMILTHHKGRIWASSTHKGAVFSFVLPFHRSSWMVQAHVAQSQARAV
jgi:signal transduction histidine kinase